MLVANMVEIAVRMLKLMEPTIKVSSTRRGEDTMTEWASFVSWLIYGLHVEAGSLGILPRG